MALEKPISWVDNVTRLNATNMNTISKAIDHISKELYGDNDNGLVNIVSTHTGWFKGNNTPNSGVFEQMRQVGTVLLTPLYPTLNGSSLEANTYDFQQIIKHPTSVPDISKATEWGVVNFNGTADRNTNIYFQSPDGSSSRSIVGPATNDKVGMSYIDTLAHNISWNYNRIVDIGNVYRPKGIFFNYTEGSDGSVYVLANTSSTPSLSVVAPVINLRSTAGNYITASASSICIGENTHTVQIGKPPVVSISLTNNNVRMSSIMPITPDVSIGTSTELWPTINAEEVYIGEDGSKSGRLQVSGLTQLYGDVLIGGNSNANITLHGGVSLVNTLSIYEQLSVRLGESDSFKVDDQGTTTAQKLVVTHSASVEDSTGTFIQGTNPSSVVVVGDTETLEDITDENKNTISSERVMREATDNAIKLALVAEVEARTNSDSIIIDDLSTAKENISSIENSLNFFSEEPETELPTAQCDVSLKSIEVGDTFNQVSIAIRFTPGSYTYGSVKMANDGEPLVDSNGYYTYEAGTGLTDTSYTYSCSGLISSQSGSSIPLNVSDKQLSCSGVVLTDLDKVIINCDVTHNSGNMPVDSIGRIVEGKRILADTIQLTTSIIPYRKPFWGYKLSNEALSVPADITSSQIRALQKSGNSVGNVPTTYTVPADTKQVFFAVKKDTKKKLTVKNITKEPATSVACTTAVVQVADARGGNTNTTEYDLWYINLDKAFTTQTKLQLTWS